MIRFGRVNRGSRLKSVILFLSGVFCLSAAAVTESFNYDATRHSSINIHNSFGHVSVAPSTKNEINIVANKRKWGKRCLLNIDSQNKQFHIEINDKGWIMDNECRVDLIVSVPTSLDVQLRAGNGNVDIVGTRGEVDVKVGSGTVRVKSDLKRLSALTGNGDVIFGGKSETTKITTGKGDIKFELLEKSNARIVARSGNGDVMISLPEKSKVHAKTTVGNGLVRNTFSNEKDNPDVDVEVMTGRGDVRIREN